MPSFYQQAKMCFSITDQAHRLNMWLIAEFPGHYFVTYCAILSKVQDWLFNRNRQYGTCGFHLEGKKITSLLLSCPSHCNLLVWKKCCECANCSLLLSLTQGKIHSSMSLFLAVCSGWTASCFHPHLRHECDHLVSRLNVPFPLTSTRIGINLPWQEFFSLELKTGMNKLNHFIYLP